MVSYIYETKQEDEYGTKLELCQDNSWGRLHLSLDNHIDQIDYYFSHNEFDLVKVDELIKVLNDWKLDARENSYNRSKP